MAEGLREVQGFFDTPDYARKIQEFERSVDRSLLRESRRIDDILAAQCDCESLQNQIDALDGRVTQNESDIALIRSAVAFRARFNGGSNRPFSFTEQEQTGGFIIIGGTELEVPTTGWYQVTASVNMVTARTENPRTISIRLTRGGVDMNRANQNRFSGNTANQVALTISGVFSVTNPVTQRIAFGSGSIDDSIWSVEQHSTLSAFRVGDL